VSQYERALLGTELRLIPIDQATLREAARLRASLPGLRTPDAIHAATARAAGCALLVTNDTGFRRVPGVNLTLLDDLIGP
jgi:predicted nucleic acid-binding protein